MVLQKQLVPVSFTGGLDTKTAFELVQPGQFLVLENIIRRKSALVQKRNGFSALGTTLLGSGSPITQGTTLASFKNDLVMLNQANLYSYAEASDKWLDKGDVTSALISQTATVRNSYKQAMPDIAELGGYTATAWEDSRGGVRYGVIDNSTDTIIVSDISLNTSGSRPRCVALSSHILITYCVGSDLKLRRINIVDPTAIESETTLISGTVDSTSPYDMCQATPQSAFLAFNNTIATITALYVTEAGLVGTPLSGYPNPAIIAGRGRDAISVAVDRPNLYNYVSYSDAATNNMVLTALQADFSPSVSSTVVTTDTVRNITMIVRDNTIQLYFEFAPAGDVDSYIGYAAYSWDGVSALVVEQVAVEFVRSVGLVAKGFTVDGAIFIVTAYDTALQPTYFIIRETGDIVARVLGGLGNGLTKDTDNVLKSGLSSSIAVTGTNINFPLLVRTKVQAADDNTILATNVGINLTSADFGAVPFITDTLGDNLHIAGGTMLSYDGVSPTEHGFHVYPENVVVELGANGAGTFPALISPPHRYVYQATYEWVDGKGQIHRSAPSVVQSADISAITNTIDITVPRLRLTAKKDPRAAVKIVIYRSEENITDILYKLVEITNDDSVEAGVTKTDDLVTYNDANQDGVGLEFREVLYTTGGVVENIAPPASKVAHKHQNRLFLGGLEDNTKVVYSKEWVFQEGVAFSDSLPDIRTDALGGEVTALGTLDDKLIIFKATRAYTVVGNGPVDTGANNDYTQPQLISGDVGTANQSSVVVTPMGLMFQSEKGIFLLSRALEMVYIGAPVERYNSEVITSATVLDDQNEVRFTTQDGPTLVYNYFFQQWSVFTNYEAMSGLFALGSFLHLKADGTVNREEVGLYEDNGSRIKMAFETSWFSFANMQGYQRVYWIACLGDFFSNHYTKIGLAYDFEEAYSETVYFNTVSGLLQTTYGTDLYGNESPYGGTGSGVYQWRLKPARQRCESIKIRMEDIDTIGINGGASFALVNLAFVVGIKDGTNRLAPNKTLGSR